MKEYWHCPKCGETFADKDVRRFGLRYRDESYEDERNQVYQFVCAGCKRVLEMHDGWIISSTEIGISRDIQEGVRTLEEGEMELRKRLGMKDRPAIKVDGLEVSDLEWQRIIENGRPRDVFGDQNSLAKK